MNFEPKHPDYKTKVSNSFAQQKFMAHIGAELNTVEPGYCEIHLPYDENLTQQDQYFHAGIVGAIADNAAGYAAFSLMEKEASVLAVEYKLNLVSPALGDLLIGKGTVLKPGRKLTICRSDVYVLKDGKEKLCAVSQSTMIQLLENSN